MPDVFISHSSQDNAIALQLAARIRDCGLTVFLDADSIAPGHDWTRVIHTNLGGSTVLLLLATKDSVSSPTVNQEVGWAMKQGCIIIPIVIDIPIDILPPWIGRYQAIVLTGKTDDEIRAQLESLLRRLSQEKRQREALSLAIASFALLAIFTT